MTIANRNALTTSTSILANVALWVAFAALGALMSVALLALATLSVA